MSETKEHPPILSPEQRKQRDQAVREEQRAILAEWSVKFPGIFSESDPRPLAIGIRWSLFKADIRKWKVNLVMPWYTGRRAYLRAIVAGGPRYHLDGSAGDDVSPEHIEHANALLAEREAKEASKMEAIQ